MDAFELMRLCALGEPTAEVVLRPAGALAAALEAEGVEFTMTGADRLDDGRVALHIQVGRAGGSSLAFFDPGFADRGGLASGGGPVAGAGGFDLEAEASMQAGGEGGYMVDGDPVDIEAFMEEAGLAEEERRSVRAMVKDQSLVVAGTRIVMRL